MSSLDDDVANCAKNKFYEDDFEYDMKLNRALLRIIGVWPCAHEDRKWEKFIAKIARFTSTFFLIFLFLPHGCHIFLVEKNFAARLKMIGAWSFCAMAIFKYATVLVKIDSIRLCINRITLDWQNVDMHNDRKIMLKNAKTCRLFTKMCFLFMYSGSMFYSTVLPLVENTKNRENLLSIGTNDSVNSINNKRFLPFPSQFYIFDAQKSPLYEIVFFGHTVSVAILCTVSSGISTLAVKFVMHAHSQYQIVISLIECFKIRENSTTADVKRMIADIVERHLHVLRFVPRVESILNGICLVEMIGSTLNICFVGYYLIMEWENSESLGILTYIILMLSFVSNIFIFCYIGELLTEQSKKVGLAIYTIDWWCLSRNQARAVIMIIAVSNFPIEFTAGKMVILSLQSFCSVIKAAVTYLNVLRNAI